VEDRKVKATYYIVLYTTVCEREEEKVGLKVWKPQEWDQGYLLHTLYYLLLPGNPFMEHGARVKSYQVPNTI